MMINTSKYYTLVWQPKWKPHIVMMKHTIWNNIRTAEINYKDRVKQKYADGEFIYKDLRILEIDIDNPSKSKFIRGDK